MKPIPDFSENLGPHTPHIGKGQIILNRHHQLYFDKNTLESRIVDTEKIVSELISYRGRASEQCSILRCHIKPTSLLTSLSIISDISLSFSYKNQAILDCPINTLECKLLLGINQTCHGHHHIPDSPDVSRVLLGTPTLYTAIKVVNLPYRHLMRLTSKST